MAKKKPKPCTLKRKGRSTNLANSEVLNFLKFSVEIRKQVQPCGHILTKCNKYNTVNGIISGCLQKHRYIICCNVKSEENL